MRYAISGASRGIGLEFVRQLLARGDTVEAGVRVPSEAEAAGSSLAREAGHRLRVHSLDVTVPSSVRSFAAAVSETPVDVVINNAGVSGKWSSLVDLDYEDMGRVMETNAFGPLRLSSALMPGGAAGRHAQDRPPHHAHGLAHRQHAGGRLRLRRRRLRLPHVQGGAERGMRTMAVDYGEEGLDHRGAQPRLGGHRHGRQDGAPARGRVRAGHAARHRRAQPARTAASSSTTRGEDLPW